MRSAALAAILIVTSTSAGAQDGTDARYLAEAAPVVAPVSAEPLIGAWRIDLTSTPADRAGGLYYAEMEIVAVEDDRITGFFYGSPMEQGRINRDWGAVRFAFVTRDGGGGVYHHSGELVDGRLIRGLSHALDRDFLAVWTAEPGRIPAD